MASSINASTSGPGGVITTADNSGILNLQTAATTALTINTSQNVGIGTTSPGQKLAVVANAAGDSTYIQNLSTSGYSSVLFADSSGTSKFAVGYGNPSAAAFGSQNYISSLNSNDIVVAVSGVAEAFRVIGSTGQTCFNTSTSFANGIQNVKAVANVRTGISVWMPSTSAGQTYLEFFSGASSPAQCGNIQINGSGGVSYTSASDRRLKTDIVDLTDSGNFIDSLKPRKFTWKESGNIEAGFIADEIQQIIPSAVGGKPDEVDENGNPKYQMLDASSSVMIANLVAEIQSLRKRIATLETKVGA